jgi:K+-transporting ATPase A subunit
MSPEALVQILLVVALVAALAPPLGAYMTRVYGRDGGGPTPAP